jgi:hypothetical protein
MLKILSFKLQKYLKFQYVLQIVPFFSVLFVKILQNIYPILM